MINLIPVQNCCTETMLICPLISTISDTEIANSKQQVQRISNGIPLTLYFLKIVVNTCKFLPILCIGDLWLAYIKVLSRSLTSSFALLRSFQHLVLSARGGFPQNCLLHPTRGTSASGSSALLLD